MRNRQLISLHTILLGIAIILTATASHALPQTEPIGTVVAMRGAVNAVTAAGESRALAIKAPVYAEDSIDTGARGRIQLLFTDNTIMSLGQNTKMKIAEYRWSESAAKEAAMKTQVKEGTFRVLGGAITKAAPKNFTTETPSATIGIRGSSYAGKVTQDNLTVVLLGGKGVNIFNTAGMVPLTKVGFGTVVTPGNAPLPPFKFTPQDMKNLSGGLTSNGEEDKPKKGGKKKGAQTKSDGEQTEASDENGGSGQAADTGSNGEGTDNGDQASAGTPQEATQTDSGAQEGGGEPTLVDTIAAEDAPPMNDIPVTFAPVVISDPRQIKVSLDIPPPPPPVDSDVTLNTTPTIPANGIEGFTGWISGTSFHKDGTTEAISDPFLSEANWYNRKFIGMVEKFENQLNTTDGHDAPVYFFGTINSDGTITNTRVIGTDSIHIDGAVNDSPGRITGSGSAGKFINLAGGLTFGFNASGYTFGLVSPSTQQDTWNVSGSGASTGIEPVDVIAPTGSVTWKGFVTGLAENIDAPSTDRRLFMNSASSDFTMNINRDSGTVGGTFAATDSIGSGTTLDVTIGSGGSAYVLDDQLIALLGGSVNSSYNLLPNSNFMKTAKPEERIASYVEWGIWEAAYVVPGSPDNIVYDIHQPGSYWVAGVPTASGNFITSVNYTYNGKAYAAGINVPNTTSTTRDEGSTTLNVNFSSNTGMGKITSGTINAGNLALVLPTNIDITSGSFTANTGFAGADTATVNGAFFGPAANSVGGNFTAAITSTSTTYIGVFGGNR
ncbi:MAG: FecR domain-containing protein [Desulfobulbaceae bacterium]|nr:FecR domain-containing protein [Desulfobulbaceae bacterium]